MRPAIRLWTCLCAMGMPLAAVAVSGVNPTGVNVRTSGPTTVFLTFQALDPNEQAVEAFWCGAVTGGATGGSVTLTNPCVPNTIYGRLPLRHDLAKQSQSGAFRNLTDIMTIPATVSRRAYQDAAAGQGSDFFYVRRFSGGVGGDKFVLVTCRMGGGGARSPLALMDVRLAFSTARGDAPVLVIARDEPLPKFGAQVLYNGSGLLRGRWEVVLPGDLEPSEQDLLTEATLPVEQRGLQRRYTLIERFDIFLAPEGKTFIAGPDPKKLPSNADGAYKILLRIEASDDKEGDSATGGGRIAHSGGIAGFPMPVLRYFIGTPETVAAMAATAPKPLSLMLPQEGAQLKPDAVLAFSWVDSPNAAAFKLEVAGRDNIPVFGALVKPGVSNYVAPPWVRQHAEKQLRWRVLALDGAGRILAESGWRDVTLP